MCMKEVGQYEGDDRHIELSWDNFTSSIPGCLDTWILRGVESVTSFQETMMAGIVDSLLGSPIY